MYWLAQPDPELCVSSALQLAFAQSVQLALLEPVAAVGLAWHEPAGAGGFESLLQPTTDASVKMNSAPNRCCIGLAIAERKCIARAKPRLEISGASRQFVVQLSAMSRAFRAAARGRRRTLWLAFHSDSRAQFSQSASSLPGRESDKVRASPLRMCLGRNFFLQKKMRTARSNRGAGCITI
jgi:hypothetical protein